MDTSATSQPRHQVIVSMTSFPAAIDYATGAVKSLLEGSVLPDKIVLYLTFEQFGSAGLPASLKALASENPIFEIRDYPVDIRSYRKLIPALHDFPGATIVTVDDDVHYHRHMLRDLLRLHELMPDKVLAHRAKKIKLGAPYKRWKKYRWYNFLTRRIHDSYLNLQTGVGGVLYPAGSLNREMIESGLYTQLAPTADDLWFWGAAVLNGTSLVPVPFGRNKPRSLGKPRSLSLKTVNFKSGTDRNTAALEAIMKQYPEIKQRINEANGH